MTKHRVTKTPHNHSSLHHSVSRWFPDTKHGVGQEEVLTYWGNNREGHRKHRTTGHQNSEASDNTNVTQTPSAVHLAFIFFFK